MVQSYSDLLKKSLGAPQLELLHLLAYHASLLHMPLYLVGGVVRDVLLGRGVKDFDLVVEGDSKVFAEYLVRHYSGRILIHAKFGTATWALNESAYSHLNIPSLELTAAPLSVDLITARSETYAHPGALPTIKPSTIDDDLRRRDFTINAMAFRLDGDHFGELYDPLGGQKDLESKTICILHRKSFVDDPTRIFRAVRYAARYGFELESSNQSLINTEALTVLKQLSGERLRHEFDLIFEEPRSMAMIADLEAFDVLRAVHHDLQFSRYKPTLKLEGSDQLPDFVIPDILSFRQTLIWILWLISLPPANIEAIAKTLAFPAVLTNSAIAASKIYVTPYPPGSTSKKTFYLDTFPLLATYAAWIMADNESVRQNLSSYLLEWRRVKPLTTGEDLKTRGLVPGPKFKEILTRLRAAWLDEEIKSEVDEKNLLEQLLKKRLTAEFVCPEIAMLSDSVMSSKPNCKLE